jgi:hypothetical protein
MVFVLAWTIGDASWLLLFMLGDFFGVVLSI